MLLSIIVPSFNQGRYLARTLDSIFAQDYRPIEVIVVDGASRDETLDVLREYAARHPELRWKSEKDNGPADAVNKGLAMARGEIAAIQSADDLYCPGAFRAVTQVFADQADCGFVIGHYRGIDAEGRYLYTCRLPEFSWEAYFGLAMCIPQSSIFFRMDVARKVGGWNPKYYGCDLDFWLRLLLETRAVRVDRILSEWRLHADGRTHRGQQQKIWDGYWQMIADNAALRAAPRRLRRLARASRHIFALYFHPTRAPWAMRWHLLLAFLQHPGFWRYQDRRALLRWLPGHGAARWLYHHVPGIRPAVRWARTLRRRWLEHRALRRQPGSQLLERFAQAHPDACFVQIGSNDGVSLDPLRRTLLRTRWRGLMVEPVPYVFERLRQRYANDDRIRLENAAIADRNGTLPFYYLRRSDDPAREGLPFWYDELGSFRKDVILSHEREIPDIAKRLVESPVPCLTFDTLCARHGVTRVDLLHMDTEGYDYALLRSIDLTRWRPRLLIYEHHHLSADDRKACREYLSAHGYEALEDGLDTWCLNLRDPAPAERPLLELWRRLQSGALPRVPGIGAAEHAR